MFICLCTLIGYFYKYYVIIFQISIYFISFISYKNCQLVLILVCRVCWCTRVQKRSIITWNAVFSVAVMFTRISLWFVYYCNVYSNVFYCTFYSLSHVCRLLCTYFKVTQSSNYLRCETLSFNMIKVPGWPGIEPRTSSLRVKSSNQFIKAVNLVSNGFVKFCINCYFG